METPRPPFPKSGGRDPFQPPGLTPMSAADSKWSYKIIRL